MKTLVFFSLLLVTSMAAADDTVIRDIRVFGADQDASLSIRFGSDGRIAAFGPSVPEAGAGVLDGQGGYITPGFIDSASTLGLEEVESSTAAEDQKYEGDRISASFDPGLAFNRDSSMIPQFMEEGITRVMIKPDPGTDVFSGQGRLLRLPDGGNFLAEAPGAVFVYFGEQGRALEGKSRAAILQRLTSALEEAVLYDNNRRAYQSGRLRSLGFGIEDLEVLAAVARGEKKLALYIDRAAEIETVLRLLEPLSLDIVVIGAREAWRVADLLAEMEVPVVINVMDNRPASFDRLGARLDQARLLHDAGVLFAFMSEDLFSDTRMLVQAAGVAVAYGLPWQAALDAITINPARIWKAGERVGLIKPGNEATFLIWHGDPLELTSHIRYIVVNGRLIEPDNRQRRLRDRYRDLHSDEPFTYRHGDFSQ